MAEKTAGEVAMGAAFLHNLERLGLLKYVLVTLLTGLAFVLTAGAYLLDERGRRPVTPAPAPAAWLKAPQRPAPGWSVRAPVARAERFAAASDAPAGFAFYDITARETPASLTAKFFRKHFQVGQRQGEACDFALPLSGPNAPNAAVAAFIRERGRACCDVTRAVPRQLATYVFGQGRPGRDGSMAGPITGSAVFSTVGGGLLTLTLRFAEQPDGYANAVSRYLGQRYGQPMVLPHDGRAWTRNGGLVTLRRTARGLVVTTYFAANIDRHASLARQLAAKGRPRATGGRLAMAEMPDPSLP